MPNTASAMYTVLPRPTAPSASGERRPTMMVSTIPMNIHPSSATTTGQARASIGRNSRCRPANMPTGYGIAG